MWTVQWALKSYWYGRGLQLAGGNFFQCDFGGHFPGRCCNMLLCERLHRPANWQPKKMHVLQEIIDFKQYLFRSYWKSIRRALKAVQNGKPWPTCRASAFCFATTVFAMQFFNALASNAKNMKRLLTLNNARAVFTNASTAVANASRFCNLTDIKGSSDHTNFKFIVQTVVIALQRTSWRNSTAALL